MRRYKFLDKDGVYKALNKLRSAFLAAKDGKEVDELIKGILTPDERLKIGRRILVSQCIDEEFTYNQIRQTLRVGRQTVIEVQKAKNNHPKCFELLSKREDKVETEFGEKAYKMTGNPKRFQKFPSYTGYKRSDVER